VRWRDPELRAHARVVANLPGLAIDLHDAGARYALSEVLVRSPDAYLFEAGKRAGKREQGKGTP
jgi:hypothetical protein